MKIYVVLYYGKVMNACLGTYSSIENAQLALIKFNKIGFQNTISDTLGIVESILDFEINEEQTK
jgi:hypothetical protein